MDELWQRQGHESLEAAQWFWRVVAGTIDSTEVPADVRARCPKLDYTLSSVERRIAEQFAADGIGDK